MTDHDPGEARHAVSDGELVRLLDGDLGAAQEARVRAHVEGCAACSARLRELREGTRLFARFLAEDDALAEAGETERADAPRRASPVPASPPSPSPWTGSERDRARSKGSGGGRPWLRAAAVAAVVVAAAASAQPVRAWLRERMGSAPREERVAPPVALPAAEAGAPPARDGSVVYFRPSGERLVVELKARPASGRLEVSRAGGDDASVQVLGAEQTVLVLPGTVRIQNSAASTADYRVTVPSSVTEVGVRVAGEPVETLTVAEGETREVRLVPRG